MSVSALHTKMDELNALLELAELRFDQAPRTAFCSFDKGDHVVIRYGRSKTSPTSKTFFLSSPAMDERPWRELTIEGRLHTATLIPFLWEEMPKAYDRLLQNIEEAGNNLATFLSSNQGGPHA